MELVRKTDPTFTNYVPRTAVEAVERFVRCRNNGLRPMLIPECLIECSRGLQGKELDMFESWMINPQGDLDNVPLVPMHSIREANDKIYEENLARVSKDLPFSGVGLPPLPLEDEKKEEPEELAELAELAQDSQNP